MHPKLQTSDFTPTRTNFELSSCFYNKKVYLKDTRKFKKRKRVQYQNRLRRHEIQGSKGIGFCYMSMIFFHRGGYAKVNQFDHTPDYKKIGWFEIGMNNAFSVNFLKFLKILSQCQNVKRETYEAEQTWTASSISSQQNFILESERMFLSGPPCNVYSLCKIMLLY